MRLPQSIKNGPAGHFPRLSSNNLCSSLQVVEFLIGTISINRLNEMQNLIYDALSTLYQQNNSLKETLKKLQEYCNIENKSYLCGVI